MMREEFPALARPERPYSYRVRIVHTDGRVDLEPVSKTKGLEPIPNVDHWTGIAGGAARPAVGSMVLVDFADGDPRTPVLVSYQPLRSAGGKPSRVSIDAITVQIGPTANLVELAGGFGFLALAALVASNLSALKTAISSTVVVASDGGASFKSTLLTALAAWPSNVAASKVKGT
jgi:hypothetical protein